MNRGDLRRIVLGAAFLFAGCESSHDLGTGDWQSMDSIGSGKAMTELITNQNAEFSFGHGWRRIELSRTKRTDVTDGISLVKVNRDGEVLIDVRSTGEQLRAYPGKPFLGAYQEVAPGIRARTFGESGLTVISSNPKAQSAILERAFGTYSYRVRK